MSEGQAAALTPPRYLALGCSTPQGLAVIFLPALALLNVVYFYFFFQLSLVSLSGSSVFPLRQVLTACSESTEFCQLSTSWQREDVLGWMLKCALPPISCLGHKIFTQLLLPCPNFEGFSAGSPSEPGCLN